jgi:hypothetical protein
LEEGSGSQLNFAGVMSPLRVHRTGRWAEFGELLVLFFIHAMGMGMWFVPLTSVLDAYGLHAIRPYAFATSAIAALVSPLFFGGLADRHLSPVQVLRWLAALTGVAMALATTGIMLGWNRWLVLGLIQLHALITAPTWSLSTTIVLSRLKEPKRQFGPVRVAATVGWLVGCLGISLMHADASVRAGYAGAMVWLLLALFTFVLPSVRPPKSKARLTVRERLGLDGGAYLDPDGSVLSVYAAAPAFARLRIHDGLDVPRAGHGDRRPVWAGLVADQLAFEMDFHLRPGFRLAALSLFHYGNPRMAHRRDQPAWAGVHSFFCDGAHLPERARGQRVARPRAGLDVPHDHRRWQPDRLPDRGVVVPGV